MEELMGNIRTYEMMKQQDQDKKEPKIEKTLALKETKEEECEENEDVAYITNRFLKVMRRNRRF